MNASQHKSVTTPKNDKKEDRGEKSERYRQERKKQKSRTNMSPQKKRREREKRRDYYHKIKHNQSAAQPSSDAGCRRRIASPTLLRGIHKTLKRARSKLALFKLDFVKKLLGRQTPNTVLYNRRPRRNFVVEHFLDKVAVDSPGQRDSTQQTLEVLTRGP
ncbi:hypothetical protein ElyMa_005512700, partial [Elysia marginata]